MNNGKRHSGTATNRFLEIERRLAGKYRPAATPIIDAPPAPEAGAHTAPGDASGANGSVSTAQSFTVTRAFACDDGAPIRLRYDDRAFRHPGAGVSGGQSHSATYGAEALPAHFEAFGDTTGPVCPPPQAAQSPTPGDKPAIQAPNGGKEPSSGPPVHQPGATPSAPGPAAQQSPPSSPPGGPPDWNALDRVAQQSLPPETEDTFVSDLQTLLTEARLRAQGGQEAPALSPAAAGQPVLPGAANPATTAQPPAPTAASPAAQAQVAGTDTPNRHALFDQLGQQMQRAVTFDMGTMSVDKRFDAIEASLDAERRVPTKRKPQARPLSPIETVEDMALMTAPPPRPAPAYRMPTPSSVEAYMLSSDIPLDPGAGGRSIPVSTLETGDLLVSTTRETPSRLIRFGTQAPVSHAMLYIGDGQVVEAIQEGVVLRQVEQAVAGSYLVVAFRHPALSPEQALRVRDYAGQQIDKPFNFIGIVRQAGFQLDRRVFCSGKTGEEHDRCVRWVGRVNLGTATNDRFFCSELVLKAYESVGLPLTTTPPNYSSPGDIPELQQNGMLAYVGHLKYEP